MPYLSSLLDGTALITIDTAQRGDGWALDFLRLSISDEAASVSHVEGATAVSAPSSLALVVVGVAALLLRRKMK